MKIATFKNMKGLIHGSDPKRIGGDLEGVLKIGTTEISISPEADSIMPTLIHGGTGDYPAVFTDRLGREFDLGVVEVRGGRISPPPATAVEIMELRCRADAAEEECKALWQRVESLEKIFDTNSLNFLIK